MNQDDKQALTRKLLEAIPGLSGPAMRELEEMCMREVECIEPLLDQIIERELLNFARFVFTNRLVTGGVAADKAQLYVETTDYGARALYFDFLKNYPAMEAGQI